jgi:hypothetical protein
MRSTFHVLILSILFLAAMQYSPAAFADGSKVYLETDCLNVLGSAKRAEASAASSKANETIVEEDSGYLSFERVTVVEKRDNEITESYVQVRNCRLLKSGQAAQ